MVVASGMMPRHSAEPENNRPAYVVDARHGMTTGMMLGGMIPFLMESGPIIGPLKRQKQLECHPMKRYIDEAKEEWDMYANKWAAWAPWPPPEYPYNYENVQKFLDREQEEIV